MIFNLKLTLGDGSLQGSATTNSMTYKINIQEGTDSTLIVPDDLKSDTGRALISFGTETEKNQVLVSGNVKEEDTDMIQLVHQSGHIGRVNKEATNSYGHTKRLTIH